MLKEEEVELMMKMERMWFELEEEVELMKLRVILFCFGLGLEGEWMMFEDWIELKEEWEWRLIGDWIEEEGEWELKMMWWG